MMAFIVKYLSPVVEKEVLSLQLYTIIEDHEFHESYSANCSYTTFMSILQLEQSLHWSQPQSLKGNDCNFLHLPVDFPFKLQRMSYV